MTTAHLPECIYTPENYDPEQNIIWGGNPCICHQLRACEQRVTDQIWGAIREGSQYKSGFEGGLDAARDAVAEVDHIGYYAEEVRDAALAAIDALLKPPSLPPTTGRALKY